VQSGRPARDYIKGEWDRQSIYEKVVTWRVDSKRDEDILAYMKNHRDDTNEAEALFTYFKNVIRWVKRLFPTYNKDMQVVDWGFLYNAYHDNNQMSSKILESEVSYLRADVGKDGNSHLESTKGIYEYVLARANGDDNPKLLSRRAFTEKDKKAQFERQRGVCPHCERRFPDMSWMAGDHIVPYHPIPMSGQINGPTTPDNLQMLCHSCNIEKSNKPFNKADEEARLQKIYAMTDEEVAELLDGSLKAK
jgi:hypothetical protein